jgi:hypothetical protein
MRSAALLPIRRDYRYGSNLTADVGQQREPWGQNAVIIGHQDVHRGTAFTASGIRFDSLTRWPSTTLPDCLSVE